MMLGSPLAGEITDGRTGNFSHSSLVRWYASVTCPFSTLPPWMPFRMLWGVFLMMLVTCSSFTVPPPVSTQPPFLRP